MAAVSDFLFDGPPDDIVPPPGEKTLDEMFAEAPVSLDVFVTDQMFMNSPRLSPIQYEAVQHIERIYLPETFELMALEPGDDWDYWRTKVRITNLITLQWGKGSGKDHVCRVASLRVAYLLLCLKNPQRYFEMPEQDTISLLNIASSSAQAERAFFRPMTRVVKRGWFADKCDTKQQSIEYVKNLEAVSGHSDAEGQEGLNLMLGVADEIDAFKSKEETERYRGNQARESSKSSDAILSMLHTSASTRFPETFKNVRISYPRYLGSTIQKLTKEAREDYELNGEDSLHYVSGPLKTWDVNPRYDRFKRIKIPQTEEPVPKLASLIKDYIDQPVMARAKYECRPARAVDTYFKNMAAIRACVDREVQPISIDYDLVPRRSEVTGALVTAWEPTFTFLADFQPMSGTNYVLHCDLAITSDRAGVTMAHVSRYVEAPEIAVDEDGAEFEKMQRLPVVKVDFVTSFSAAVARSSEEVAREIQIRWMRQLVFELIKRGFHIVAVTYDGFQSVDSMQQLTLHGIISERRSTDLKEEFWRTLRDVSYEGRLEMPFSQLVIDELESLGRFAGKVDHPPAGCFVGDTRVPLLDGRNVRIEELADGEPVWLYTSGPHGAIEPARAVGRRTKQVRHLIDVGLDSGAVVRCTPEHLWRLRDGSYKEARLLTAADRLMHITRTYDHAGYERVTDLSGKRKWTHVLVREFMDAVPLSASEVSHHDNEVKTDNRPENLIRMDRIDHLRHHATARHADDPDYREKIRAAQAAYWATDAAKEAQRAVLASGKANAARLAMRHKDQATRRDLLRTALDAKTIGEAAKRVGVNRNTAVAAITTAGFSSWEDFKEREGANHRVRFVEFIELLEPVWVYDLEVEREHNFALTAGVFVHNSKDEADSLAVAVSTAIEYGGEESGEVAYASEAEFHVGEYNVLDQGFSMIDPYSYEPAVISESLFGMWH